MRYQGKLVEWNDAKGFGFVLPNAGGRKIFVHLNAFSSRRTERLRFHRTNRVYKPA